MTKSKDSIAIPDTVAGAIARSGRRPSRKLVHLDNWINEKNGFGSGADPMSGTSFFDRGRMQRGRIDALYTQDWLSRKAVDAPAMDATRRWLEFVPVDGNTAAVDKIKEEFVRLDVRRAMKALHTEGRLYGGSVMVIGAFDGRDVDKPLTVERVRAVSFLNVVDRFLAYPLVFNQDPNDLNFGEVELYQVTRVTPTGSQIAIVHASRVIRMDGEFLPALIRARNFGWGISVLEKMQKAFKDFGVANQSAGAILQDFVSETLKLGNLEALLTSCDYDAVEERIALAKGQQSIHNLKVIGDDEEITRQGQPVTGLDDLLQRFMVNASAASDIPMSRLFHATGGALAGDGGASADLRNYYDDITAFQKVEYTPRINRLIDIIGAPHKIDHTMVGHTWLPLWEPTDKEAAETKYTQAQTDQIYIETMVLDPQEVALARFGGPGVATGDIVIDPKKRKAPEPPKEEQPDKDKDNGNANNS